MDGRDPSGSLDEATRLTEGRSMLCGCVTCWRWNSVEAQAQASCNFVLCADVWGMTCIGGLREQPCSGQRQATVVLPTTRSGPPHLEAALAQLQRTSASPSADLSFSGLGAPSSASSSALVALSTQRAPQTTDRRSTRELRVALQRPPISARR